MARLYLFAIGGTGARVARALTHTLAAGAALRDDAGQPLELVPLLIDPDADNGDTLDCLKTLVGYSDLREKHLEPGGYAGGFFGTRVSRYQELRSEAANQPNRPPNATPDVVERESFRCGIGDKDRSLTFGDVIGYDVLSGGTRLFIDAIYSKANLETRLSGGFLGNPNLGTIVLNRVKGSEQFRMLPGLFQPDDRIFIISSIFGGTGAAGFPVLVKLLRDAKDEHGTALGILRKAPIGALTVLPYFSIEQDAKSPIDSNAFVPKTKAALAYYAEHLDGIQSLYYIGDRARKQYSNRPTGPGQSNQDHVVEFLGATAVLHFARQPQRPSTAPRFLECAVNHRDEAQALDFGMIGDELLSLVGGALTEFAMATRFLQTATAPAALSRVLAQPWVREGGFDKTFFSSGPMTALHDYGTLWWEAFDQMATNQPVFRPFGSGLADLRKDAPAMVLDPNKVNMALNQLDRVPAPAGSVKRLLMLLKEGCGQLTAQHYSSGIVTV